MVIARLRGRLIALLNAFRAGFAERYEPSRHYMRGPGPKSTGGRDGTGATDLRPVPVRTRPR